MRFTKLIILLFTFSFTGIFAQADIPVLKNYVNDFTGTLSGSDENQMEAALRSFDKKTSNQIIFLMNNSLDGYPLEMFTYEVADKNNIGTKENNNGVLFYVAKNDRKMRIEVGYGLEGALPDALASSILRNEVKPYFAKGDYSNGIRSGLNAIISATVGEYTRKDNGKDDDKKGFPWGYLIFILLFLIFGRGRGGLGTMILLGGLGGMSGGRSSGGSFGGFGGFSGGGGSFGGGGASGSW
ncbi:MAG: TPM domain-containing protein [Melioribacteraceae bacterium]|nr:TPM domain-containing protein [Melioribacteraceae bacterium]MCF8356576.1 TPM domain-containing protein [Melioribacteraceae bacterium]MCF8395985.1 TPM domain-containing protein [Melioribacteraceae bacterium]MCF8421036.1 TPM domain-containing protein [Melioribacteraceae bacterium]